MTDMNSRGDYVCGKRGALTSLVLQMLLSVAPQALPGVAFQGMIPAAETFKHVHLFSHNQIKT